MKTAEDYLAEANAVVPKIAVEEAIARHTAGVAVFIDVRDGSDIAETGTIAGALHIPRGFVEFAADESTPFQILRGAGLTARPTQSNDVALRIESVASVLNRMVDGLSGILIDFRSQNVSFR